MQRFYHELASGADKASALAHAQRSFVSEEGFEHPFFWAAFALLGDGKAPIELRTRRIPTAAAWLAGAGFLFAAAVALRWRSPITPSGSGIKNSLYR
jgi:hypothetical protein